MNEPTANVEDESTEQPQHEQDYRKCPDHRRPSWGVLYSSSKATVVPQSSAAAPSPTVW
jgi:hypothetical protein